jgi:putative SOS response-associated peptidase YedK
MVAKASEVAEGELFAFAGIWDRWRDPSGNTLETCSILTTTPNAVTSAVHTPHDYSYGA